MVGVTPLVDEFAEDIWYETEVSPHREPLPAVEPSTDAQDEPRTADPASVLRAVENRAV